MVESATAGLDSSLDELVTEPDAAGSSVEAPLVAWCFEPPEHELTTSATASARTMGPLPRGEDIDQIV